MVLKGMNLVVLIINYEVVQDVKEILDIHNSLYPLKMN